MPRNVSGGVRVLFPRRSGILSQNPFMASATANPTQSTMIVIITVIIISVIIIVISRRGEGGAYRR